MKDCFYYFAAGSGTILGMITIEKANAFVALFVGLASLLLMLCKLLQEVKKLVKSFRETKEELNESGTDK